MIGRDGDIAFLVTLPVSSPAVETYEIYETDVTCIAGAELHAG